ncbi:MAG: DUF1573 domain-containing protein [Planctomycetaceae bacterium]|nr:DUF1573 domain-containing protein [Planctomycetaceae bacterium]
MLRWVILSVVVVVLAAAATLAVQYATISSPDWNLAAGRSTKGPQPRLKVTGSLTHEFGVMATQKVGTHKWTLRNVGNGDLDSWLGSSTCSCTVPKLKSEGTRETVKPGGATEIEVEWSTKDHVGEFAKSVTIGTNDPNRPELRFSIHGEVHSPIVILPIPQDGVISLGDISTDEIKRMTLAVFSPDRPELKLTNLSSSKPEIISLKHQPMSPAELDQLKIKAGYRVNIEIKPGASLGTFREEMTIETDHPDQPQLQLVLAGTTSGPIGVVPSILRFVTTGRGTGSGQVLLLARGGRSTRITVASKPANLEVGIQPNETATLKGRYRLTATVLPQTPPGIIEGEIILETDYPNVRELKIPVSIVVGAG